MGSGWRGFLKMICPTGKAEYFFERDWTGQISLIRLGKFAFTRKRVYSDIHHVQAPLPLLHSGDGGADGAGIAVRPAPALDLGEEIADQPVELFRLLDHRLNAHSLHYVNRLKADLFSIARGGRIGRPSRSTVRVVRPSSAASSNRVCSCREAQTGVSVPHHFG